MAEGLRYVGAALLAKGTIGVGSARKEPGRPATGTGQTDAPPARDAAESWATAILMRIVTSGPPSDPEGLPLPGAYYVALAPSLGEAFRRHWASVGPLWEEAYRCIRAEASAVEAISAVEAAMPAAILFGMTVEREIAAAWFQFDGFDDVVEQAIKATIRAGGTRADQ